MHENVVCHYTEIFYAFRSNQIISPCTRSSHLKMSKIACKNKEQNKKNRETNE